LCRHDHGLSWDEFQNLTLANIEALEERRNVVLRYDRFNAALIACAMTGQGNPLDFVPGCGPTPQELQRQERKKNIFMAFAKMNPKNPDEQRACKAKIVARLLKAGVEDAAHLFDEVLPDIG
jgi:hypothetical protein